MDHRWSYRSVQYDRELLGNKMFAEFSYQILLFLFFVALFAGFIDTLAGGGGLIALPALILAGVPPLTALGTNKLQGAVGTATSTLLMLKKRQVTLDEMKPLMLTAFFGACAGTLAIQLIDTDALSFIIPITLLVIAIYFLVSPTPKPDNIRARVSPSTFKHKILPTIGFYDGFFGPGTGSFFALANVLGNGKDLIKATAMAKPLNFSTNVASLAIFIGFGQISWIAGALMIVGQIIGASLGSHVLLRIKPVYIRVLIVLVCSAMLVRYGYDQNWLGTI